MAKTVETYRDYVNVPCANKDRLCSGQILSAIMLPKNVKCFKNADATTAKFATLIDYSCIVVAAGVQKFQYVRVACAIAQTLLRIGVECTLLQPAPNAVVDGSALGCVSDGQALPTDEAQDGPAAARSKSSGSLLHVIMKLTVVVVLMLSVLHNALRKEARTLYQQHAVSTGEN